MAQVDQFPPRGRDQRQAVVNGQRAQASKEIRAKIGILGDVFELIHEQDHVHIQVEESLEQVFRYGRPEKLAFCGSGALLGIQRLAETFGSINIIPGQTKWGINVRTWETPFGTIHLKTHPLFSYNAMDRNRIVLIESENLVERYITQTKLKKDNGEDVAGWQAIDGTKQEYLTETGLEIHHAHTFAILDGVGLDNPT